MNNLFPDYQNEREKEWRDMPEFVQDDQQPNFQIIVSFATFEDVRDFADLLGMNVTPNTKSTWFPHRPLKKNTEGYASKQIPDIHTK